MKVYNAVLEIESSLDEDEIRKLLNLPSYLEVTNDHARDAFQEERRQNCEHGLASDMYRGASLIVHQPEEYQ